MSDLIDRRKALDGLEYEMKYGAEIDRCGLDTAYDIIENIPSAEQERKAKVKELERRSETSIGWEGICTNCGAYTIREMDFCFQCGAKLGWE